jgi:hypothetical protein
VWARPTNPRQGSAWRLPFPAEHQQKGFRSIFPESFPRALLQRAAEAESFADWLRDQGDALIDAADMLGGPIRRDRAETVVGALRDGDAAARHPPVPQRLADLLSLRRVDDPFSPEALRFAAIHPDCGSDAQVMALSSVVASGGAEHRCLRPYSG